MSQHPGMADTLRPTAPTPEFPAPLLNWSEDQLVRLEYEWTRLQRAFAYHPFVRIVSMRDDPPGEYEIEFRVRTLAVNEAGDLEYAQRAPVRVWLPPSFPYSPPVVRPLTGLFHPNISWDGVHLSNAWQPTDTLSVFLKKIGELLAWRLYDPQTVANPLAMDWLQQNPTLLPLDAQADFAPEAGGQPIERIRKYGASTLEQLRGQLQGVQEALLSASPPRAAEVRDFSRRTRVALKLFLADDVPDDLRRGAAELEVWADHLAESVPAWNFVRLRRAAAESTRAAAEALSSLKEPLLRQLAELDSLDPPVQPNDPFEALGALPSPGAIETLRLRLPALVSKGREEVKRLHERLAELDESTPPAAPPDESAPDKRLHDELRAVLSEAECARQAARSAMSTIEPVLARAAAEAEALRRVALWREYFDLLHTGRDLEKKLAMWGGAGIHAYYIENESGRFGPFQFEQPIDLGNARLSVRSTGANRLELIDARTARVLATSDTGSIVHEIAGTDSRERYPTTFQLTDRWEDLAVLIEYVLRETAEHLAELEAPQGDAQSWCARFLHVFADAESHRLISDEHHRLSERWSRILHDVRALAPLKARIEIWYFVQRLTEAVPRIQRAMAEEQKKLQTCTDELAAIIARCARDIDTDRLVVPPKLARPYTDYTVLRDRLRREVARVEKRLRDLGQEVSLRLSSPALFGSNAAPELVALPPLPQGLSASVAAMSDAALDDQIGGLEKLLNQPLQSAAWKAATLAGLRRPEDQSQHRSSSDVIET